MDTGFDFNMIWSGLSGFIALLVFGICLYFLIVKPCTESILLAIGSFIHLLTSLFYSVGMMVLSRFYGVDFFSNRGIFNVVGAIGLLGAISFSAGLIVLIINYVRVHKKMAI